MNKFITKIIDWGDQWYSVFLLLVIPVFLLFLIVITTMFVGLMPLIVCELAYKCKRKEIKSAFKECWISYVEIFTNPHCPLKALTPQRWAAYRSRSMLETLLK